MRYSWGDFSLDREKMLLTRDGQQIDVARKTMECIHCLIENRDRVVGYDELIRKLWGHDSVTNHQLSQVILAARRTLGDDGVSQRQIRTASGLGYRWVATVREGEAAPEMAVPPLEWAPASPQPPSCDMPEAESSPFASPESVERPSAAAETAGPASVSAAIDAALPAGDALSDRAVDGRPADAGQAGNGSSDPPVPRRPVPSGFRIRAWLGAASLGGLLVAAAMRAAVPEIPPTDTASETKSVVPTDGRTATMRTLEALLAAGKYEEVREALAKLTPALAGSPDARMLEIELDLARGRTTLAQGKIERERRRADAAADPLWQARLQILQGRIYLEDGRGAETIVACAERALALQRTVGEAVPAREISQALRLRAYGRMRGDQYDEAMRDLVQSRDLLLGIGDRNGVASLRADLARAWMRVGRLHDALDELQASLQEAHRYNDKVGEIYSLNTISRVQVELLRWDDALATNGEALRLLRAVPASGRLSRALQLRAFILVGQGRLHEASSNLEEAMQVAGPGGSTDPVIAAYHRIESGAPEAAFAELKRQFASSDFSYDFNPMLNDAEGPLLLWTLAAEQVAARGGRPPALPAAQAALLERPKTPTGQIALGLRLWSEGKWEPAEASLRQALQETRRMGHAYRMTLAADALIRMLLQRGDVAGAQSVFLDLRTFDPRYLDRDYTANLLDLRIALAEEDPVRIRKAYRRVGLLAGERAIPADVAVRYRELSGDPVVAIRNAGGAATVPDSGALPAL